MNRFFKGSMCMLALSTLVATSASAQAITADDAVYKTVIKENPTGAVETITAEMIEKYNFTSTEAMVGQFAALNGLQIRGSRSTSSSEAYILIDGFEQGLDNVEVEDIASIQILKDAAATAKYGIRGGNGVILVITKRGYKNDKPDVKAKLQNGFYYNADKPDMVDGTTYNNTLESLTGISSTSTADIDWADEMLKPIVNELKASVQVSGGTENSEYYMSAMYTKRGSQFNHDNHDYSNFSGSDQINFRSNLKVNIDKNTDWTVLASAVIGNDKSPEVEDYVSMLYSTPASRYNLYNTYNNADGTTTQYYDGSAQYQENPLGELEGRGYTHVKSRMLTLQTKLEHRMDYFVKGLSANASASFKSDSYGYEYYSASYQTTDGSSIYGSYSPLLASDRSQANGSWDQNRWQAYSVGLGYDRVFNDKHSLSASLGAQLDSYILSYDLVDYNYFNLAGNVTYAYDNRYVAQLITSYGGSNALSPDSHFVALPTLGLAWNVSNEGFWDKSATFNALKVRASVGLTGTDELGDAARFMYLNNYVDGDDVVIGTTDTGITSILQSTAGYDGKYEKSVAVNFGIDAELFDSALKISLDYFNESRYDIYEAYTTQVSGTWGGTTAYYNHGKVHSQGVELVARYAKAINKDLHINASLIAGYSKNIIKDAYEYANPYYSTIGGSVNQIYGLTADGIYQASDFNSDGSVIGAQPTYGTVQAGDIKYEDLNDDNVIDSKDISGLSSDSNPINLGLNVDIRFKKFNFGLVFDSQLNSTTNVIDNIIYAPLANGYDNISTYAYDNSYSSTNTSASLPRLSTTESLNNSQVNSIYVANTSYLRLRTAMVGYTFDIADKFLGVNLCAHNLFTIDSLPKSMSATNLDYAINGSAVTISVDFTF